MLAPDVLKHLNGRLGIRILIHGADHSEVHGSVAEDFGEIVFNMVEHGVLGKSPEDNREAFSNGYDFSVAFCHPFNPKTSEVPPQRESSLSQKG